MSKDVPSSSRYNVVQVEHGVNIEDQVNDPMEEDDNNKKIEDEGTNRLIHDTFARTEQDKFHDIHDVPLLDKVSKLLYEGSRENILSSTLLLVNLMVLNGLSNTCMT